MIGVELDIGDGEVGQLSRTSLPGEAAGDDDTDPYPITINGCIEVPRAESAPGSSKKGQRRLFI